MGNAELSPILEYVAKERSDSRASQKDEGLGERHEPVSSRSARGERHGERGEQLEQMATEEVGGYNSRKPITGEESPVP